MSIAEDGLVMPEDIKITRGEIKKFKEGDDLACSCCGYAYNTWDMILLLADVDAKKGSLADRARGITNAEKGDETVQGL